MVNIDLADAGSESPDGIELRIARADDLEPLIELMAAGFSLPRAVAEFGVRIALDSPAVTSTEIHVAVVGRERRLVGFGYLTRLETQPVEGYASPPV